MNRHKYGQVPHVPPSKYCTCPTMIVEYTFTRIQEYIEIRTPIAGYDHRSKSVCIHMGIAQRGKTRLNDVKNYHRICP